MHTKMYENKHTHTRTDYSRNTVHFCILALGSRAWCARIPDNSSLVHLEKGVRERSKEKRRSVVEDLGRWAGKNGAAERERSTEWSTAKLTKSPMQRSRFGGFGELSGLDEAPYREKHHMGRSVLPDSGSPEGKNGARDALPRRQWA